MNLNSIFFIYLINKFFKKSKDGKSRCLKCLKVEKLFIFLLAASLNKKE